MNYTQSDRGDVLHSVGAPGSIARMRQEQSRLIAMGRAYKIYRGDPPGGINNELRYIIRSYRVALGLEQFSNLEEDNLLWAMIHPE